jgi:glycosyltransferase involved in cell wall biosynthesis
MKILHIDTEKTWRGGEQQVLYLACGLRDRGHESTIVCQPGSPLAERAKAAGIAVEELRMRGGVDPKAVLHIAKMIRKGYDILHLHTSNAHTIGYLASLFAGRAKVVVSRRVSFPLKGFFRRLKYKGADRIIAVSEGVRREMINSGIDPDAVVTVHSAIDASRYKKRESEPARPVVGIIAHLAEHKGHRYFFEAAKEVAAVIPDVNFLVVGEGEMRTELEEYVRSLGVGERTVFAGFQKDVAKMISQCTITVLSSISGEGSPGVLKESMAAGIPAITTDVGGSREVVEDGVTGIVIPPMDSKALASAMIRLLKDGGLRERMGGAGIMKVQEFTPENMVTKTEAVYKDLLK